MNNKLFKNPKPYQPYIKIETPNPKAPRKSGPYRTYKNRYSILYRSPKALKTLTTASAKAPLVAVCKEDAVAIPLALEVFGTPLGRKPTDGAALGASTVPAQGPPSPSVSLKPSSNSTCAREALEGPIPWRCSTLDALKSKAKPQIKNPHN